MKFWLSIKRQLLNSNFSYQIWMQFAMSMVLISYQDTSKTKHPGRFNTYIMCNYYWFLQ